MNPAEQLVSGPRGRDLLLNLEDDTGPSGPLDLFHRAATTLDVESGAATIYFPVSSPSPANPASHDCSAGGHLPDVVDVGDIAATLRDVELAEITWPVLRDALACSVDNAAYWQEPCGAQILAAAPEMRGPLLRIAGELTDSPLMDVLTAPFDPERQWTLSVRGSTALTSGVRKRLTAERDGLIAREAAAAATFDPEKEVSGVWWSAPMGAPATTAPLPDGTPSALWFEEDSFDDDPRATRRIVVPGDTRILEITGADSWADLCRRFPVEVTRQRYHDWHRTTGRRGRWVIPDWAAVAEHHDAVHLTHLGYLAAAGRAIDVDAGTASVIAGWNPGETYWLTDVAVGDPVHWSWDEDGRIWARG